jgi:hypothetical protein
MKYSSTSPPPAAAGIARPLLHLLVAAVRLGVPLPLGWSWGKPHLQVRGRVFLGQSEESNLLDQ